MMLLIGIGGALGAAARYSLSRLMNSKERAFPFGTWLVNIIGSFLLGYLVNLHLSQQLQDWLFYLLGAGFCGGFTTFSTFGVETVTMIQAKKSKIAILYVVSSLIIGGISATIGIYI